MTLKHIHLRLSSCLVLVFSYCISFSNSQQGPSLPTGSPCPPIVGKASCVCQHPDGVIDLTSYGLTGHKAPRFSGLEDPNKYPYTFNPCVTYSVGQCSDVYICQQANNDPNAYYEIARQGTEAMFIDDDGTPYLYYTSNERSAFVYLHCTDSKKTEIETIGDSQTFLKYEFNMHSCHVCPGGCAGGSVAGIAGIVIILLLLVGVAAYFIIGAIIMKVHFKANGSDIIPNKAFWFSFPFLLKDGFMFTFGPCISFIQSKRGGGGGGYSEMKS